MEEMLCDVAMGGGMRIAFIRDDRFEQGSHASEEIHAEVDLLEHFLDRGVIAEEIGFGLVAVASAFDHAGFIFGIHGGFLCGGTSEYEPEGQGTSTRGKGNPL
jgi:hypothetical protein